MPAVKSKKDYLRQVFEYNYGKPIQHSAWLTYLTEIQELGFKFNHQSVATLAQFKRKFPRTVMRKEAYVKFAEFQHTYRDKESFLGYELMQICLSMNETIGDKHTVRKYFYKCNLKYKMDTTYTKEDVLPVVVLSLLHKKRVRYAKNS